MIDDAGGPALDELAVPAGGTVGVPVDFSATPLDAWSAIVATHWSFGDGTTATDESVSHAYAAPGTYTVGTSSGDILGNTTSQNSSIVIAPAGGTGTGPSTSPTGPTPGSRSGSPRHTVAGETRHARPHPAACRSAPASR
jgi:PKD repeat protein